MAQQFRIFSLRPLLPDDHQLVLNCDQAILSALVAGQILEQQVLTPNEVYVLEELLKNYPDYCPYEVILSAMTGQSIETCQEKVLWGLQKEPSMW